MDKQAILQRRDIFKQAGRVAVDMSFVVKSIENVEDKLGIAKRKSVLTEEIEAIVLCYHHLVSEGLTKEEVIAAVGWFN